MKVTISLTEQAFNAATEGAKRLNISRSAYIAIAIMQKQQQDMLAETLPQLLAEMQDFKERLSDIEEQVE